MIIIEIFRMIGYVIKEFFLEMFYRFKEDTKRDFGIDFTKSYVVRTLIGSGLAFLVMAFIFFASDVNNGMVKPFANEVVRIEK